MSYLHCCLCVVPVLLVVCRPYTKCASNLYRMMRVVPYTRYGPVCHAVCDAKCSTAHVLSVVPCMLCSFTCWSRLYLALSVVLLCKYVLFVQLWKVLAVDIYISNAAYTHRKRGCCGVASVFFLCIKKKYRQTTESGIPQPFRATVRYRRINLDFWPRSAALIGQLSLAPVFDINSLRYIVPRLFSSAVTAF